MAFVPIQNNQGISTEPTPDTVRVSVHHAQVRFTLSRSIVRQLGWQFGDRILVSFGVGADLGAAILTKVTRGGQKLGIYARNVGTVQVTIPGMVGQIARADILAAMPKSALCEHELMDGQVRIVMPKPRVQALRSAA